MEIRVGHARNVRPQVTPERKEKLLRLTIRKQTPTPRLVRVTIDTRIVLVDGNATRRIRL